MSAIYKGELIRTFHQGKLQLMQQIWKIVSYKMFSLIFN